MKKLISVAAFLAASSALASAGTVVFDDFFGTAGTSAATFVSKIFNDKWKPGENPDLFSDATTNFKPVYYFGISPNSAGTLYYGNNGNSAVDAGNDSNMTVNSDGSASIDTHIAGTTKGNTVSTYWNTLSAETLASVSDLSISFTGGTGCDTLQLAVFYVKENGGADDIQRLFLLNSITENTDYSYSLDDIATGAEATGGTLLLAVLNTNTTQWQRGILSDIVISGTAIPEPSAFGLLAGAGALALVAARRRRRAK